VLGVSDGAREVGLLAVSSQQMGGAGTNDAAHFQGNVTVFGDLTVSGTVAKGGGTFKIDHPLDPTNKYLYHSFVESPEMMNIYSGTIALDANGEAVVTMPDYFQALNGEYRYQLTSIGAPGPNLYIAEEISKNTFRIAGGAPGAKVSWEVTGVRHDAYAKHNRVQVEVDKPAAERGTYLHPEAFGVKTADKGLPVLRQALRTAPAMEPASAPAPSSVPEAVPSNGVERAAPTTAAPATAPAIAVPQDAPASVDTKATEQAKAARESQDNAAEK
jgi:hypothetical protein